MILRGLTVIMITSMIGLFKKKKKMDVVEYPTSQHKDISRYISIFVLFEFLLTYMDIYKGMLSFL